jgi:hypothetical protein
MNETEGWAMAENKVGAPTKPLVRPAGESPARRPGQPGSVDEDRATARTPSHVPAHSPKIGTDDLPRPVAGAVKRSSQDKVRG